MREILIRGGDACFQSHEISTVNFVAISAIPSGSSLLAQSRRPCGGLAIRMIPTLRGSADVTGWSSIMTEAAPPLHRFLDWMERFRGRDVIFRGVHDEDQAHEF